MKDTWERSSGTPDVPPDSCGKGLPVNVREPPVYLHYYHYQISMMRGGFNQDKDRKHIY